MSNAAEISILVIMLFFFVLYTVEILERWTQMVSVVNLPFLSADYVEPINSSAASCILLRVMREDFS